MIAEKPLALHRADLDAVYAAVKRSGIHLGMLLPMRFDPPYLAMRRIVESGAIGEVLQMDAQKSYQLGARPAWQKHAATYGSTILWIAIHSIDLMLWVSGRRFTEAASLQSHVGFPEAGDMQNVTATLFRLDNGGSATLHMDYLRPAAASGHGDDRLRVSGSRGIVEYQESTGVTLITGKSGPEVVRDLPQRQSVFLDFLQSVYQGSQAGAILAGDRAGQRGHPGRSHGGRTAPVRGNSAGVMALAKRGQTGLTANFRQRAPEIHVRLVVSPRGSSNGIIMGSERWQSGRSHPPRKRAYLNGYREFESPPLRQLNRRTGQGGGPPPS